jgi:hypothetical protein
MKLPFSAAALTTALLLPILAHADDAALTDTLKAFTRCDASFFSRKKTSPGSRLKIATTTMPTRYRSVRRPSPV